MRTVNSEPPEQAPFVATVATMSIIGVILASQAYATIPLMPHLGRAWNVPEASAAWATSVFAIAYACSSLVSGSLADRYGRRITVVASLAVMAVATVFVPMAGGFTVGCALRAVQGAMAGFFAPVVYTYFSERIAAPRLALALTVVSCSLGGTLVIGQVAAQLLASTFGWGALFWLSAPLLGLGAILAWRIMLADPAHTSSTAESKGSAFAAVLRSAPLIPLFASALAVLGGVTAIYTAVQLFGPAGLGRNADAMIALRASALPALIIAVLITPKLSRVPALHRAAGALAVAGLGMLGAAFFADSVTGLALTLFVCVLGVSAAGPALVQAIGSIAGTTRATAIATYSFILNFGAGAGALLPPVVGVFGDLAGFLAIAFGGCVALAAISAKLTRGGIPVPRTRQRIP